MSKSVAIKKRLIILVLLGHIDTWKFTYKAYGEKKKKRNYKPRSTQPIYKLQQGMATAKQTMSQSHHRNLGVASKF